MVEKRWEGGKKELTSLLEEVIKRNDMTTNCPGNWRLLLPPLSLECYTPPTIPQQAILKDSREQYAVELLNSIKVSI